MTRFPTGAELVVPSLLIVGGVLLGLILETAVFRRITRLAMKTGWKGDEIVVSALRVPILLSFLIAGIYGAVALLPLSERAADAVSDVLLVGIILTVTLALARLAGGLVNLYSFRTEGALPSSSIFGNLTKILVFVIGVLVILQSLGISITPLLTALGVGGLAVALALQDTISNLFAGLHILASKQIRPGDYIELDSGERGYVIDINWRNTTIRRLPNNMVVVPNSRLAAAIVTNYYLPEMEMAVRVPVGVSYDSDLAQVEQVTEAVAKEVMKEVEGGVSEFVPFIRYDNFNDSSIDLTVVMRAKEVGDQYLIKHEFIKRLHERYADSTIEIPFPIRTVHLTDERNR